MINFNPLEKEWFCNEWRSVCFKVRKGAKKKGVDLSKMEIVKKEKKGCEED